MAHNQSKGMDPRSAETTASIATSLSTARMIGVPKTIFLAQPVLQVPFVGKMHQIPPVNVKREDRWVNLDLSGIENLQLHPLSLGTCEWTLHLE